MAAQPSFRTDDPSDFFADGLAGRRPVQGTVARGHLRTDAALYFGTSKLPDQSTTLATDEDGAGEGGDVRTLLNAEAAKFSDTVDSFPFPITRNIVERGRNRYMIYCVVCHDATGTGHGKIVERGFTKPPSYHIERLRTAPVGYLFRVITRGYGSMPSYAGQIAVEDRWAIVSYLRALQLSQHYPVDKLPENIRANLPPRDKLAGTWGGAP